MIPYTVIHTQPEVCGLRMYPSADTDPQLFFSIRRYLLSIAHKLKSRNNLDAKLAGISWDASASILGTSALAICYLVAEYCCLVWARSSYTNFIDTQLHSSVCLISGQLYATKRQLTRCFTSSKPIQTGPCMLMS